MCDDCRIFLKEQVKKYYKLPILHEPTGWLKAIVKTEPKRNEEKRIEVN